MSNNGKNKHSPTTNALVSTADDDPIIGNSQAMMNLRQIIKRVAPTNAVILIQGESGTGKELVARQLHQLSGRHGQFVAVNCGAISDELLESELFGHTAGAFTGAKSCREGLFSYASNGTIFLDEIGEMPLKMQTSLLRVLEQRTIRSVGSEKEISINVRVIAATNKKLLEAVEAGTFRKDLFYRLNVLDLFIPPLRDRPDDILAISHHFALQLAAELGLQNIAWEHKEFQQLQQYDWPGNIRELRNIIERCLLLGETPTEYWAYSTKSTPESNSGYPIIWPLSDVEKAHITRVVNAHNGNKSAAAKTLGVSRKTLERKYKQWFDSKKKPRG